MASQSHGRFREQLAKLLKDHPGDAEQSRARSALMWLCVAQRSLRAHELWIAVQIEATEDVEHVEQLVNESGRVGDQSAAARLQNLLGDLVTIHAADTNASESYVSCGDRGFFAFLDHLADEQSASPEMTRFSFSAPEAHLFAARACMTICSATTLHLMRAHDENIASSLSLYAWKYWSTHLSLSGYQLSEHAVAKHFDAMVHRVCIDASVFLLGLNDFIVGPITLPATEDYMESIASIREAQLALEESNSCFAELVRGHGYSTALQNVRSVIQESKPSGTSQLTISKVSKSKQCATESIIKSSSAVEALPIDRVLHETFPLVDTKDEAALLRFLDVAHSLRSTRNAFARSPIHRALLAHYGSDWSPFDVLDKVANWMEAVASYPYWTQLRGNHFHDVFRKYDPGDSSSRKAIVSDSSQTDNGRKQPPESRRSPKPRDISGARWLASGVVYNIKWFRHTRADSPLTMNDLSSLSQQTSSFAAVPSYMHSPDPLIPFLRPLIPSSLHRLLDRHIAPLSTALRTSGFFSSFDEVFPRALTSNMANLWSLTKPALLSDGYGTAFVQFGIAVLVHHIRRTLIPWLGAWIYNDPLEDLRLARGNPEVFLDEALAVPWPELTFMHLQKHAFDLAGALLASVLVATNGRVPPPHLLARGPGRRRHTLLLQRALSVAKVCFLAWMLAAAEYMFARTLSSAAFALALAKLRLLSPAGSADRAALALVLRKHRAKLPLHALQLALYGARGIAPMAWGAAVSAAPPRGRPGLLLVLGALGAGVWAVLRYRARFFIALEMGGMFVVLGCAGALFGLLGRAFVDDPLGVGVSAARARRSGDVLRRALPADAEERMRMFERRRAVPAA